MVDTGHAGGMSIYQAPVLGNLSNEYAAMPSLHVGWALLLAVVLVATGRTRWRWLWFLHLRDAVRRREHRQPLLA